MTTYAFIDGNYFMQGAEELLRDWLPDAPLKLNFPLIIGNSQKTFFYDSLPSKKMKDETQVQFDARLATKTKFFDEIRSHRGWHVQEGISKRIIGERAQQKEVDVLLAVEMLTHSHRKNMSEAMLFAGDQDFRPLVDAVVRDGTYVTLWHFKGHTAPDLINMADHSYVIDIYVLHHWLADDVKLAHELPSREFHSTLNPLGGDGLDVGVGTQNGEIVAKVLRHQKSFEFAAVKSARHSTNGQYYTVGRNKDWNLVKRIFEQHTGPIEWSMKAEHEIVKRL